MTPLTEASPRINRWRITAAPPGWYFVPDFGLRHNASDPTSNIHLGADVLLAGNTLLPYIEAQKDMLARRYDTPVFAGPQPNRLLADRTDEAMLLLIRHQPGRGLSVLQVQTYVRLAKWIGIATLTTTDGMLHQVRPDYEAFLTSLHIEPEHAGT